MAELNIKGIESVEISTQRDRLCTAAQFLLNCFGPMHHLKMAKSVCFVLEDVRHFVLGMNSTRKVEETFSKFPFFMMDDLGFLKKKTSTILDLSNVTKEELLLLFFVCYLSLNGKSHFEKVANDFIICAPQVISMILSHNSTSVQLEYFRKYPQFFQLDNEGYLELDSSFFFPLKESASKTDDFFLCDDNVASCGITKYFNGVEANRDINNLPTQRSDQSLSESKLIFRKSHRNSTNENFTTENTKSEIHERKHFLPLEDGSCNNTININYSTNDKSSIKLKEKLGTHVVSEYENSTSNASNIDNYSFADACTKDMLVNCSTVTSKEKCLFSSINSEMTEKVFISKRINSSVSYLQLFFNLKANKRSLCIILHVLSDVRTYYRKLSYAEKVDLIQDTLVSCFSTHKARNIPSCSEAQKVELLTSLEEEMLYFYYKSLSHENMHYSMLFDTFLEHNKLLKRKITNFIKQDSEILLYFKNLNNLFSVHQNGLIKAIPPSSDLNSKEKFPPYLFKSYDSAISVLDIEITLCNLKISSINSSSSNVNVLNVCEKASSKRLKYQEIWCKDNLIYKKFCELVCFLLHAFGTQDYCFLMECICYVFPEIVIFFEELTEDKRLEVLSSIPCTMLKKGTRLQLTTSYQFKIYCTTASKLCKFYIVSYLALHGTIHFLELMKSIYESELGVKIAVYNDAKNPKWRKFLARSKLWDFYSSSYLTLHESFDSLARKINTLFQTVRREDYPTSTTKLFGLQNEMDKDGNIIHENVDAYQNFRKFNVKNPVFGIDMSSKNSHTGSAYTHQSNIMNNDGNVTTENVDVYKYFNNSNVENPVFSIDMSSKKSVSYIGSALYTHGSKIPITLEFDKICTLVRKGIRFLFDHFKCPLNLNLFCVALHALHEAKHHILLLPNHEKDVFIKEIWKALITPVPISSFGIFELNNEQRCLLFISYVVSQSGKLHISTLLDVAEKHNFDMTGFQLLLGSFAERKVVYSIDAAGYISLVNFSASMPERLLASNINPKLFESFAVLCPDETVNPAAEETVKGKRVTQNGKSASSRNVSRLTNISLAIHDGLAYLVHFFEIEINSGFLEIVLHIVKECAMFFDLSISQQKKVIIASFCTFRVDEQGIVSRIKNRRCKLAKDLRMPLCMSFIISQMGPAHFRELFKCYKKYVADKRMKESDELEFFTKRKNNFLVSVEGNVNLVNVPTIEFNYVSILMSDTPVISNACTTENGNRRSDTKLMSQNKNDTDLKANGDDSMLLKESKLLNVTKLDLALKETSFIKTKPTDYVSTKPLINDNLVISNLSEPPIVSEVSFGNISGCICCAKNKKLPEQKISFLNESHTTIKESSVVSEVSSGNAPGCICCAKDMKVPEYNFSFLDSSKSQLSSKLNELSKEGSCDESSIVCGNDLIEACGSSKVNNASIRSKAVSNFNSLELKSEVESFPACNATVDSSLKRKMTDCNCTKDSVNEFRTRNFFIVILGQSNIGFSVPVLKKRLLLASSEVQHYVACVYDGNIQKFLQNHSHFCISPTSGNVLLVRDESY